MMNDENNTVGIGMIPPSSEHALIGILLVLVKYKRMLAMVTFTVAVVTAGITLLLPNVYRADTKVLPPQQAQNGAAALLSQLGAAAGAAAAAAGVKNPNDLYIGMLRSRSVTYKLIKQFDLLKVYDVDTMEKARKVLESHTVINSGKDNMIIVAVEDKDRKMVAPLANAYITELLNLTKDLAVTEAGQRRLFYERQLEQAKNNLAKAEMTLKRTLDTHGMVSVGSDGRAIVETGARLRALISEKEIQLGSMRAFVTKENQDYKRSAEELNSLRGELNRLENGRPEVAGQIDNGANTAGMENVRILRDLKYYEMLYGVLAKQYESARLDEARETSNIQVLDPAIAPERKYKPLRAMIVFVVSMLAFLTTLALAFFREARLNVLADPQRARQWQRLNAYAGWKRHSR